LNAEVMTTPTQQLDMFGTRVELGRVELRATVAADVAEIVQPGWFDTDATFAAEVERRLEGIDHTTTLVAALPDVTCQRCGALSPHWLCEACHIAQSGTAPW
jgi:hypothetical protein